MSIDASQLVQIVPRIIGGGGTGLELNGLLFTQNPLIPAATVTQWTDAASVGAYFGVTSAEAALSTAYFLGFDNSNVKPRNLFFAAYAASDRAAWLRGGVFTDTVASLKTVANGALTLVVDEVTATLSGLSFTAITSFSDAALVLQDALEGEVSGATVTYSSQTRAFQITSPTAGATSSVAFAQSPASTGVTDMATLLHLTQATGALLSSGTEAQSPADALNTVLEFSRNWVAFSTVWEPELEDKLAFAQWVNGQGVRFVYVAWDTDILATQPFSTSSFGSALQEASLAGTVPVYDNASLAAFVLGTAASIDFNERNGRITFAFKAQSGQRVTCDESNMAEALAGHGYNFYGDYATANDAFKFYQTGSISGPSMWLDTYINQVAINNDLQLALMNLFANVKSLPYNEVGYAQVRAACMDPILKYINFGAIVPGVPLSQAQASQVNQEAGLTIAPTLEQQGWYLQVLDATAQNRANRKTPPCKFWYMDGGSIQQIIMSATVIQ